MRKNRLCRSPFFVQKGSRTSLDKPFRLWFAVLVIGGDTHRKERNHKREYLSQRGRTPIEKNILVTDANGNQIGSTYPKRAKGLVKSGRAEYVGDCEIRLLQALSPTVIPKHITEEHKMSKVINFSARDFRFDPDCMSNAGGRVMVSTDDGVVESFEIGDWGWKWTQIIRDIDVEPHTDYTFRFAMNGGHNDDGDELCQVMIFPEGGWEERYVFPLEKSRFRPVLSKRLDPEDVGHDTFLRVYEIPFSTGDATRFRIMLVAHHAVARFLPAKELSAYADMEDQTYAQWYAARMERLRGGRKFGGDWENYAKGIPAKAERIKQSAMRTAQDALRIAGDTLRRFSKETGEAGSTVADDAVLTEAAFSAMLRECEDGHALSLDSCDVTFDGAGQAYDVGAAADGLNISASDVGMTTRAFLMLLQKMGDGCNADLSSLIVNPKGAEEWRDLGYTTDGSNMDLSDAVLSTTAFAALISKLGDGVNIDLSSVTVTEDGCNIPYEAGERIDGANIDLSDARLPMRLLSMVYQKMGDGCNVNASSVETF